MTTTAKVPDRRQPGRGLPRPSVRGFGHVNRFFDRSRGTVHVKILPGEFYVTTADEVISTVLGSCVAACIWDPVAGIGGMNHFMIPTTDRRISDAALTDEAARYGMFAMEFLINTILKNGGDRSRLLTKIAGGGHVMNFATNIGQRNIDFVRQYLTVEGLALSSEHVGGPYPMKLAFRPLTGGAQVKELRSEVKENVVSQERSYAAHLTQARSPGDVEIF